MRCHVLVEKPITSTLEAAQLLIDLAQQHERILAVGHIERCNPIVAAVKRRIDDGDIGTIYRVSTRRVGPSPVRIRDVGVTLDLLTHDLDVARYLLQAEPVTYHAEMLQAKHGNYDDAVTAIVRFENDVIGAFEADWLSSAKERTLTVTGSEGVIMADYLSQTAVIAFEPSERVKIGTLYEEPLLVELRSFVAAVRGEGRPAATGDDGLQALAMATRILESAKSGQN
jgi:predicted dehydrogenase